MTLVVSLVCIKKGIIISVVMVSVLSFKMVDHEVLPWASQTKDYQISICCFPAKHVALRSKSKD